MKKIKLMFGLFYFYQKNISISTLLKNMIKLVYVREGFGDEHNILV